MLSVYGIKNCNTVKKGLDWLNKNKIDYEFFDVKKINLTDEKISEWIDNMSEPYSPENLLNKSGMTWRKLSDNEKNLSLTKKNIVILIKKYPTAMKRPLIINNKEVKNALLKIDIIVLSLWLGKYIL